MSNTLTFSWSTVRISLSLRDELFKAPPTLIHSTYPLLVVAAIPTTKDKASLVTPTE